MSDDVGPQNDLGPISDGFQEVAPVPAKIILRVQLDIGSIPVADVQSAILAVDVGNSRFKFALFRDQSPQSGRLPTCLESVAIPRDAALPWDQILKWPHATNTVVGKAIAAGANPEGVARIVREWPSKELPVPRVVDSPLSLPLAIDVEFPERVGIDRLMNALAVNAIRPAGWPAIVVGSGTATTVDLISREGAFLGGAILPGFELCALALHRYTALLPLISIDELARVEHAPLGKNTREAIHSGLFWGQVGAVSEIITHFRRTYHQPALVYLTGGGGPLLKDHLAGAQYEPHLGAQGIALLAMQK